MSTRAGCAEHRRLRILAVALALFFAAVQCYTSLAALSPTPPVGYVFLGRRGAEIVVALLFVCALVAAIYLVRERARIDATSRILLGAWIGSALLSTLLGLDPRSGLEVVAVMLLCGVFHVALRRFYRRAAVARTVLGWYLLFGIVACVAALVMVVAHRPPSLYALNHGRAAGFFVTANQFATYVLLLGYVAVGVGLSARERTLRSLAWLAAALALCALVASFSRAGWIGAGAGAVFFLGALGLRKAALWTGAAGVACAGALAAFPIARHDPSDSFNRVVAVNAGARALELFPLTGTGPMSYWRIYPTVRPPNGAEPGSFGALHPHDVYLSLAGETGLVGMLAFAAGLFAFARSLARAVTLGSGDRRLAFAICAGVAATLVQGIFDTIGIVQMTFVWIPYSALALAAAESNSLASS